MIAWLTAALFVVLATWWYLETRRPKGYPPGPRWWPIVGNTLLLHKWANVLNGPHMVFERWMEEYRSPLIGLRLGTEHVVVAMTDPMVKAVHTGDEFVGRPDNFFFRQRTMGTRLGITCTDGDLWTEQRSFAVRHLRQAGFGRKPMDVRINHELMELFNIIDEAPGIPICPSNLLPASVFNVLWVFAAGTRIPRDNIRLNRLITLLQHRSKAFDMSGGILNQLPWLRFIAPERTGYNMVTNFNIEIDHYLTTVIDEHKANYHDDKASDDLIYAFLKEMRRTDKPDSNFTDTQLKMSILDLFIGGAMATSISTDLAIMTMVTYPHLQARIHDELKVLDGRTPCYADSTLLPFTRAFILEIHRYYHIMPIGGPRRTLRDTELGGYRIPRNTTVFIVLRTVHMDAEYWGDPEVFRPERFLDENMNIVNTDRVMPFGQGKRRCLGDGLANNTLFTFFTGLMQRYRVDLPAGAGVPDRNLISAITLAPKPYKVIFTKR